MQDNNSPTLIYTHTLMYTNYPQITHDVIYGKYVCSSENKHNIRFNVKHTKQVFFLAKENR